MLDAWNRGYTCVRLQRLGAVSKLATERLVILLVGNSSEEIDTMQVMEDFHSDSIALFSRLRVLDLQHSVWHTKLCKVFQRQPLVAHYLKLVAVSQEIPDSRCHRV